MAPVPARGDVDLTATFSDCGRYRYLLTRRWAPGDEVLFVMLNPSTADARRNDPTVSRCLQRARAMGFSALAVVNLFAWRSTHPAGLRDAPDPVGPGNDAALSAAARRASLVLCAWGDHGALHGRGPEVAASLRKDGHNLWALGLTSRGHPRHPLYTGYDVAAGPWDHAACKAM